MPSENSQQQLDQLYKLSDMCNDAIKRFGNLSLEEYGDREAEIRKAMERIISYKHDIMSTYPDMLGQSFRYWYRAFARLNKLLEQASKTVRSSPKAEKDKAAEKVTDTLEEAAKVLEEIQEKCARAGVHEMQRLLATAIAQAKSGNLEGLKSIISDIEKAKDDCARGMTGAFGRHVRLVVHVSQLYRRRA